MKKFCCWLIVICFIGVTACTSMHSSQDGPPRRHVNVDRIPDAKPQSLPHSKFGNPHSYKVFGKRYYVMKSEKGYDKRGYASWYGTKFHAMRTSSGEPYDMYKMTAASKVLPIPCFAEVTNLENGHKIIVKVNDRGPFEKNRIMDLSYVAAAKLGMLQKGTAPVEVKVIDPLVWARKHSYDYAEIKPAPIPVTPVSHLASSSTSRLYLQIAAFSDKNNALDLENKIADLTHAATRIESLKNNGAPLYRVQIGPIASVETSDAMIRVLERAGYSTPRTVIE